MSDRTSFMQSGARLRMSSRRRPKFQGVFNKHNQDQLKKLIKQLERGVKVFEKEITRIEKIPTNKEEQEKARAELIGKHQATINQMAGLRVTLQSALGAEQVRAAYNAQGKTRKQRTRK